MNYPAVSPEVEHPMTCVAGDVGYDLNMRDPPSRRTAPYST
jgi:hypothetical protein